MLRFYVNSQSRALGRLSTGRKFLIVLSVYIEFQFANVPPNQRKSCQMLIIL